MNGKRSRAPGVAVVISLLLALVVGGLFERTAGQPKPEPEGEMRWALYVTIAPLWFDPERWRASSRPSGCSTPSTMRS